MMSSEGDHAQVARVLSSGGRGAYGGGGSAYEGGGTYGRGGGAYGGEGAHMGEEEKEEVHMKEEVHKKAEGVESSIRMKLVMLGQLLGKQGRKIPI